MSLTAVILVGGEGTRLRPLTQRTPKPMLPLVDRPLIEYTFEHLRRYGVTRVVLSCGYLPTQIQAHYGAETHGVELVYRVEESPLGTGGAIAFGAAGLDEAFLAVNGDSLRGADLGALIDFHREKGAKATIMLTPVSDPSRFGLVRLDHDGRVTGFLEKPRPDEIDTNLINAGVYVLEPEILALVPPGQMVSIERDVFPRLVKAGTCFGLALPGYWLDVGTPESYLQAHRDVLERNVPSEVGDALGREYMTVHPSAQVSKDARLVPPVVVGPNAVIEAGVRVGSLAVIGSGAHVGEGSIVEHAVLQAGAELGSGCIVLGSIVGEGARLGAGTQISGLSVVGPGAHVGEGNTLDAGLRVAADAEIPPRALSFA